VTSKQFEEMLKKIGMTDIYASSGSVEDALGIYQLVDPVQEVHAQGTN
jgi:ASC-1-like (ASCH) protein